MAKKKKSWGLNLNEATDAAESVIKETSHKTVSRPVKPKKKVGRPKTVIDQTAKVQIYETARKLAKKVSVLEEITMTDYISSLINKDAAEKGIKINK